MKNNKSKVYIVDDDESIRRALKRLIKSEGYEVETFDSGEYFFNTVSPETKGILILDVCMPEMDGFELQIKLNHCNSNLQIIFISAYIQDGDREKGIKAGAKGFLSKPFSEDELMSLIDSL